MNPFNLPKFLRSFAHAGRGWRRSLIREQNMQVHTIIGFLVIVLAVVVQANRYEVGLLALSIGLVLSLELVNSAVEKVIDRLHPDQHPEIGYAKDALAGAVLVAAIAAVAVAAAVFIPHLQ